MNLDQGWEISPLPFTNDDADISAVLPIDVGESLWLQDAQDAAIMVAMTLCQGKPADKLAAAQTYMRLKGYD